MNVLLPISVSKTIHNSTREWKLTNTFDVCYIYIGRTYAEVEVPILWPPEVKILIGKDPDAGKA